MSRGSAYAALALLTTTLVAAAQPSKLPHPGPRTRDGARKAPAQNPRCTACHREIADEWRASRHHQSFTNAEFRASLAREGAQAFCIDCHAPETLKSGAPTPTEAELGVSCLTCHVPERALLAGTNAANADAPHPLEASPLLTSAEACKACHEFRFADARPGDPAARAQWMQRTWTEHHDGKVTEGSCSSCHMPRVASSDGTEHASHRFIGGYDDALVKAALDIVAERRSPTSIELRLTPRNVTHAVPTGDLFRRLMLTAESVPARGAPAVRFLARHHQDIGGGRRRELSDDRPFLRPSTVTLELDAAAANLPIAFRVVYQRVDHLVGDDESKASVTSEIELARAELPALTAAAPASRAYDVPRPVAACNLGAPRSDVAPLPLLWLMAMLRARRRSARRY